MINGILFKASTALSFPMNSRLLVMYPWCLKLFLSMFLTQFYHQLSQLSFPMSSWIIVTYPRTCKFLHLWSVLQTRQFNLIPPLMRSLFYSRLRGCLPHRFLILAYGSVFCLHNTGVWKEFIYYHPHSSYYTRYKTGNSHCKI